MLDEKWLKATGVSLVSNDCCFDVRWGRKKRKEKKNLHRYLTEIGLMSAPLSVPRYWKAALVTRVCKGSFTSTSMLLSQ